MDSLTLTLKDIHWEFERTINEENKTKKHEYAQQLINYQVENIPINYIDQTNFNLFTSRTKGRSKKDLCTYISAGSRGTNIHIIYCVGNMGLIYNEIRREVFKKPEANELVRCCLRNVEDMYQLKVILVTDNTPCHASQKFFK